MIELTERQKFILEERNKNTTYRELGKYLNITGNRVRCIHLKAMAIERKNRVEPIVQNEIQMIEKEDRQKLTQRHWAETSKGIIDLEKVFMVKLYKHETRVLTPNEIAIFLPDKQVLTFTDKDAMAILDALGLGHLAVCYHSTLTILEEAE